MLWEVIIQYSIMGFMAGFTGAKLFSKNKKTETAIKIGCATSASVILGFLALMWRW